MLYNLHTHTARCNHATGEDREYVEEAIKRGVKVLGFSDHCPQFFKEKGYYSHFRMKPDLAYHYVESIKSLREEYKSDIKILVGFEAEYYPETFEALTALTKELDMDYMIMGEHLIGNEYDEDNVYEGKRTGDGFLIKYVDQVIRGLETGVYTYIAHPDIPLHKGNPQVYSEQMTRLCTRAKELDIPLEANMLGIYDKKCYPSEDFWKIAGKVGNKAVIGFDAHTPQFFDRTDLYNRCFDLLKKNGLIPLPFEEINIRKPY